MVDDKDKDVWRKAYQRALRTTVRYLSPHAPLEAPPGFKKPRLPAMPSGKRYAPPAEFTLDAAFQECRALGMGRSGAATAITADSLS
jgi:hypothetical protein